ncbi:MAG: chorismate mutase [Methanomicrobiales archaeon]|nr:chorismate mutase [Methanomicrobiales archaeon]MDI6876184.1 chorismate mutase [Methanomicrobiales archaeon]
MSIQSIREEMEAIDAEMIRLIGRRQQLSAKLALIKQAEGLPIRDEARKNRVLERVFDLAVERKIDPVPVQQIFEILIRMSEERQRECMGEGNLP